MHVIVFIALAVLGFAVHVVRERPAARERVLELALLYAFVFVVGAGGLFGFTGHTLVADDVARQIGWPAGNPFQTEVAFTNLAFGVLGLLCIRFRGDFWLATGLGWGIFLVGAGITHALDWLANGNTAPSNTGPVLYGDFLKPAVLLAGILLHRRWTAAEGPRGRPLPEAGSG
jgi:hypothetical protein